MSLPISDRLYLRRSTLPSFNLDFSAIPASKIIAVSTLGAITSVKGKDLDTYYRGLSQNALYNGYLVVLVDQPLSFQWDSANPSNNEFLGKVIFIVDSQLHVNGQFYTSMGRSRTVIAVRNNGVVNGMASPGRFQGYIHVKDSGSVTYQPGSESEFIGAIHHTGVATGMQINGSGTMALFFDQAVLADLERIGVLSSTY